MPIEMALALRRPTFEEFKAIAYEVMACAFSIHNSMGRLFREHAYKQLVARRLPNVKLEVPVVVSHGQFRKTYYLDMVVDQAAIFEWKATEDLSAKHRSQLLNYLLLADLPRGKLINVGRDLVQHEFVNTTLTRKDRLQFSVDDHLFHPLHDEDRYWQEGFLEALRDWGVGLDLGLYEELITFLCGGDDVVKQVVEVVLDGASCGHQAVQKTRTGAAFRVTAFGEQAGAFVHHASQFLKCTNIPALHWVNVNRAKASFRTLLPEGCSQQIDLKRSRPSI